MYIGQPTTVVFQLWLRQTGYHDSKTQKGVDGDLI